MLQKIWGMQFVVVLFKVLVEEIENLSWVRLKDFIENSSQLAEGKLLLEEHKVWLGNLPIFFFFLWEGCPGSCQLQTWPPPK